jgi:hypothetical protein
MYPSGHDLTVGRWKLDVARQPDTFGQPLAREVRSYFTGTPKLPPLIYSGRFGGKGLLNEIFGATPKTTRQRRVLPKPSHSVPVFECFVVNPTAWSIP